MMHVVVDCGFHEHTTVMEKASSSCRAMALMMADASSRRMSGSLNWERWGGGREGGRGRREEGMCINNTTTQAIYCSNGCGTGCNEPYIYTRDVGNAMSHSRKGNKMGVYYILDSGNKVMFQVYT